MLQWSKYGDVDRCSGGHSNGRRMRGGGELGDIKGWGHGDGHEYLATAERTRVVVCMQDGES